MQEGIEQRWAVGIWRPSSKDIEPGRREVYCIHVSVLLSEGPTPYRTAIKFVNVAIMPPTWLKVKCINEIESQ